MGCSASVETADPKNPGTGVKQPVPPAAPSTPGAKRPGNTFTTTNAAAGGGPANISPRLAAAAAASSSANVLAEQDAADGGLNRGGTMLRMTQQNRGATIGRAAGQTARETALGISTASEKRPGGGGVSPQTGSISPGASAASVIDISGGIDLDGSPGLERKASTAFTSAKARARAAERTAKDQLAVDGAGPLQRRGSTLGELNRTLSQQQMDATNGGIHREGSTLSATLFGGTKTGGASPLVLAGVANKNVVNGTPKLKHLVETMNKFRQNVRRMKEVSDSDIQEMRRQQEQYAQLKLGMAQQIAGLGDCVDVVGRPNRQALYDLLEAIMAEGEAREGTVALLQVCLVHLGPVDWQGDFICGQRGGKNMLMRCAQEGWFQMMELLLTAVPGLTFATAADVKEVLRLRELEQAAANKKDDDDDDDFLADVDGDEDVQPIDSCGDFAAAGDSKTAKNTKKPGAAGAAAASPSPSRSKDTDPSFVDPVELLAVCVRHPTARIPLCGTLCKHWSLLRFVEYNRQMMPLWRELVAGLCSPVQKGARREVEDRTQRVGMLQRILGLSSAIPINVNEVDPVDSGGDGYSLIARAIVDGETGVFQTLTRKAAEVDWRAVLPDSGHSLLTLACACSQRAIVELLLQQPAVDPTYAAPGHGTALEIVRNNGGNAQITALLEKRLQQMEDARLAADLERIHAQQDSHVDALRRRLQGKKRAPRAAAPPKWIEASMPTVAAPGVPGSDIASAEQAAREAAATAGGGAAVLQAIESWIYDRDSKPEVLTGPVLDVCNTLREHWELIKSKQQSNSIGSAVAATSSELPLARTASGIAVPQAQAADAVDPDDVLGDVVPSAHASTVAGGPAASARSAIDSVAGGSAVIESVAAASVVIGAPVAPMSKLDDEAYLLDGATLRGDLCSTLLSLGTRIVVEGKDPKEKVHGCVARLLSEGSATPHSIRLARILMFRIATVDFAPSLAGTSKWALQAAKRGDVEALDTLLRVDKLWREEHEVVELVMHCVRFTPPEASVGGAFDPTRTSAWTKMALCLVLLRNQKQMRFGSYRDHLRPLWEELIDVITNPAKINMTDLLAEQQRLHAEFAAAAESAQQRDYRRDDYARPPYAAMTRESFQRPTDSALRFELLCRLFANPAFYQLRHDIEIVQGISWFSRACRLGDVDYVRAANAYCVSDVNKLHSNKSTPLMQAVVGNQLAVVKELCRCADLDLFVEGPGNVTALDLARQMRRDQEMIDVIMQAGEKQLAEADEKSSG